MRANVGLGNLAPAYRRDVNISLKYTIKVTPVYSKEESISLDKTTLP
jgi:hypothetical protein